MKQPRIFRLLSGLRPAEMREFCRMLEAGWLHEHTRLSRLAPVLLQAYPHFPAALTGPEPLHQALFGAGAPFSAQQVHDQLSVLMRLLEQYWTHARLQQDAFAARQLLLEEAIGRCGDEDFARLLRKSEQLAEQQPLRNSAWHYHRYRMLQLQDAVQGRSQNRALSSSLPEAARELDAYYFASRLRAACELRNRRNIVRAEDVGGPDAALWIARFLEGEGSSFLEFPAVAIYFEIYRMLSRPDPEPHYETLLGLLSRSSGQFERTEAYAMYTYAQNFCIKRINTGQAQYLDALFGIYQALLEEDLLLESGVLAHEHYKNITTVGLRLRRYEWVMQFLEAYQARLSPEVRENAYTYNLAVYHYERQAHRTAMQLLQRVEFTDVYYHLSAKALLARIYYEQGEYELLGYLLQAFRGLLRRDRQISDLHRQAHAQLVQLLGRLMRLRMQEDRLGREELERKAEALRQDLAARQGVTNADWLRRQIAAMLQEAGAASG